LSQLRPARLRRFGVMRGVHSGHHRVAGEGDGVVGRWCLIKTAGPAK
jgi:hypothetical protein